jgi:hypothetical protein
MRQWRCGSISLPEIVLNLRIFFVLAAETEKGFSMANGMFKMKMDIDRHGQTYDKQLSTS